MQISGRIINARHSSLNVLDMRINLIKISLRNIGNFCAFGAPTIAVIPVRVHKIGKKRWKHTFVIIVFSYLLAPRFVFALPLWWLDTRPPSFCTVLGSPNPFSGSFEVTFNIFELFGQTCLLSLSAGGFTGFFYTVNK